MRKINLANYMVTRRVPNQADPTLPYIEATFPYEFKETLLNLMFIPQLQLSSAELVKQTMLAMKLEACREDEIILEEEEWGRLTKAIDTFKGFGRPDIELVTRITEAEVVEVEPKK